MNQRTSQRTIAVSLALCLFLASSLLTATAATHATHSGHDHATHQQTWCGWLCAAGQAIQTPALEPSHAFTFLANTEPFHVPPPSFLPAVLSQSRAPPTFHLPV